MGVDVPVLVNVMPHGAGLPLPHYASALAAGCDLAAAVPADEPLVLAPGARALVPTGLAIALPDGFEAQVRPRSGLAHKHGVTVLNAPGTVDADYRGEVKVLLVNLGDAPFFDRARHAHRPDDRRPSRARELSRGGRPRGHRASGGRVRLDRVVVRPVEAAATNVEAVCWCPRGDSNSHILADNRFSYHFDFRRPWRHGPRGFVVWTIPSP